VGEEQRSGRVGSALQALLRVIYKKFGRAAREPKRPEQRSRRTDPWATRADGSKKDGGEVLDRPPLHILRRGGQDLQRIYAEVLRLSAQRENAYKDYEDMILDPTISGALELMIDDACQFNREKKATVWVNTDNKDIKLAADELWDIGQIEDRIWDWGFNGALYGDWMVQPDAQVGKGIIGIMDDWHPADVQRIDVNGQLLGWRTPRAQTETMQAAATIDDKDFHEAWEFVHFRIQASQRRRREVERQRMMPSVRFEKDEYRLTTRYGVSILEAVRRIYKQLQMVEQSLIIARMTRALKKYLYKVKCGTSSSVKAAAATCLAMRDLLTQQTGLRIGERFEQQFSPLSGSEDVFLPEFGERGGVEVQELGGEVDVHAIVDVDYLRNKLFGGLTVPKAYLGFEESLPGSLGESALLRLDIRYARKIKRIQRMILQGLTRLLQIHLAYKKIDPDPRRFAVEMDVISTAEEEERKSTLMSSISVARDMVGLNQDLGFRMPPKELGKLIYGDMLGLKGEFVDLIDKAQELPMEAMGEPAGGAGMPGAPAGEMPPPEEAPGEGPLEMPPPPEEEKPEEGPLETPAAAESTKKPDIRAIVEKQPLIAAEAKRQATDSVTRAVRHSQDVSDYKKTTPQFERNLAGRVINKHNRPMHEHMQVKDFSQAITVALTYETRQAKEERQASEDAWEKMRRLSGDITHLVEHPEGVAQVTDDGGEE
jgi:hypothetical protein